MPATPLGADGIGQIFIQILKHAGTRVIAISRSQRSLELASAAGAELCLGFNGANIDEQVAEFTAGLGAACVMECVGKAQSMKLAAICVARGGQVIVIGEEPEFPVIDTIQIAQREIEIIGSRNGSKQDAADALGWLRQGIVAPPIVNRRAVAVTAPLLLSRRHYCCSF